jgi:hypothetical protein
MQPLAFIFENCFPGADEDGDSTEWSLVQVFAEKASNLVSIIGPLGFPRYALENVPEELLDDLSKALSNQTPSLKALELKARHLPSKRRDS